MIKSTKKKETMNKEQKIDIILSCRHDEIKKNEKF